MNIRTLLRDAPLHIKSQPRAALAAWVHFTRIPLPAIITEYVASETIQPHQAIRYLPLASASVGLISGLVFLLTNFLTHSTGLAALTAIITTICFTGAFRERGAGHFFDAFSRDETNQYARAIGASGTIAVLILIIAKWQLLASIPSHIVLPTLITAYAFSNFVTMAFLYTHKPLQPAMHGRYTVFSDVQMTDKDFMIMALFGMLPVALLGHPLFILLLPLLWIIRALLGVYLTRRPERYSSDALALTQQSTELGFYLGVLIIVRFATGI